jgi:hypothetical protein
MHKRRETEELARLARLVRLKQLANILIFYGRLLVIDWQLSVH